MGNIAKKRRQLAACTAGVLLLSSCSTWTNRYRPIDIDANMPRASELVQGVQQAIDRADDGNAWDPNGYYKAAKAACSTKSAEAKKAWDDACTGAYTDARKDCRKARGVAGPSLCADYFRQATQACAAAATPDPTECDLAKLIAPPKIAEAKLQLTAAVESGAGASVEYLTLLSAKASRKLGRKHTLEITLIPRPAIERAFDAAVRKDAARSAGHAEFEALSRRPVVDAAGFTSDANFLQKAASLQRLTAQGRDWQMERETRASPTPTPAAAATSPLADSLSGALKVALNATLVNDETAPKERQLTLKRMFYQFEIDYTREVGGELKWTISPITASVQGSKGSQAGNIVTIEVVR